MRTLLLAATALALLGGTANSQTNSTSGSNSNATVNTSSGSSSVSSPRVTVSGNPIGNGASSSTSGARAVSNTRSSSRSAAVGNSNTTTINVSGYSGIEGSGAGGAVDPSSTGTSRSEQYVGYGGSYTLRNTPEIVAPSVVGGNACAIGASGGLSLPGFGLAMGATWADQACERRQQAALLFNMGEQKIAMELMCQDVNVRAAMRVSGKPCVADIAAAQVTDAAPTSPVQLASAQPLPAVAAREPRPDWCTRAAPTTEASRAYVAQVCGK